MPLSHRRAAGRRGPAADRARPARGPACAGRDAGAHRAPGRRGRGRDRERSVELQSGARDRGHPSRDARREAVPLVNATPRPLKIGIGGPVGSGKTALAEALCRRLAPELDMAVITNDIYTKEDAEFLVRRGALPADRVVGVETGGCPHTAIREDASANLEAVRELQKKISALELLLIESGGGKPSFTVMPPTVRPAGLLHSDS